MSEAPQDPATPTRDRPKSASLADFGRKARVGLVAGLPILPGALALFMTFFYLGDWPTRNPFDQVFYGVILGVAAWIVLSVVFLHGLADVKNGDAAAYDELVMRATTLKARVYALVGISDADKFEEAVEKMHAGACAAQGKATATLKTRKTALLEAHTLWRDVRRALDGDGGGSAIRWAGASGYTSLWRQLHRAEEALLAAELKESLYAEAIDDEARLMTTKVDEAEKLIGELRRIFGDPKQPRDRNDIADGMDTPEGRALLRKIRFVLNSYRDDLYQRFVRIRNAMFATLVYVGLVADAVLGLTIVLVPRTREDAVATGLAYYLVGALVGLFAELYGASRGQRGAVHDYGLSIVRLLTIPVLSGIAGVLGVVITRLAGGATLGAVTLDEIFSLETYPLGVVVAAIFGLTPGLLLERLRAETNEYKDELMKSAAGTPGAGAVASSSC